MQLHLIPTSIKTFLGVGVCVGGLCIFSDVLQLVCLLLIKGYMDGIRPVCVHFGMPFSRIVCGIKLKSDPYKVSDFFNLFFPESFYTAALPPYVNDICFLLFI